MIAPAVASSERHADPIAAPLAPLWAGQALDSASWNEIRTETVLDNCKWDPQVGDVSTLSPFPVIMPIRVWRRLAARAEVLFAEAAVAEQEILSRSDLLAELGLPRALFRVFAGGEPLTPALGRVTRFDFHWTTDGWRISEANSDVPGGFAEGSAYAAAMARRHPGFDLPGNPGQAWARAVAGAIGAGGHVALLSAPGYMEDHQVVHYLASLLRSLGCEARVARPENLRWSHGRASLETKWHRGPLDAVFKFYQAEWLSKLSTQCGWPLFFRGGQTLVGNPAAAVISESKRFPLVWPKLSTALPTWQELLPETRSIMDAPWQREDDWLLKTAFCNNGDTVSIRGLMPRASWWKTCLAAAAAPYRWLAQRRFDSVPIATPSGPRHVCIGVYVVNGHAAGAYTRLSKSPVIDYQAMDAALLIDPHD